MRRATSHTGEGIRAARLVAGGHIDDLPENFNAALAADAPARHAARGSVTDPAALAGRPYRPGAAAGALDLTLNGQ